MHAAALLLLPASVLVCCTLLVKAAQFAAGCWRAHRRFSDSPIPGPKPASRLLGRELSCSCSMHGRSAVPGASANHTRCMRRNRPACLQATFPKSWGPRMPGCSRSGQTRMAPCTSSECWTTFCWSAQTQTRSSSSHEKEVRSGILAPLRLHRLHLGPARTYACATAKACAGLPTQPAFCRHTCMNLPLEQICWPQAHNILHDRLYPSQVELGVCRTYPHTGAHPH